jgi:hypothetical protein
MGHKDDNYTNPNKIHWRVLEVSTTEIPVLLSCTIVNEVTADHPADGHELVWALPRTLRLESPRSVARSPVFRFSALSWLFRGEGVSLLAHVAEGL